MNEGSQSRRRLFWVLAVMFDRVDLFVLVMNLLGSVGLVFGSGDSKYSQPITVNQVYACLGVMVSTLMIIFIKGVLTLLGTLFGPKALQGTGYKLQATLYYAPGYRLLRFVRFFYGTKAITRVFEPLVADWQQEYFEALSKNDRLQARWISVRYSWKALLAMGLLKALKNLASMRS